MLIVTRGNDVKKLIGVEAGALQTFAARGEHAIGFGLGLSHHHRHPRSDYTGLLGSNLVRQLLADGWRVRALVRSPEKAARQFAGLDVEIVQGDMLDVAGFADALSGVDVVFHGHDHLFVKEDLDANGDGLSDLVYQECPQPSATNILRTSSLASTFSDVALYALMILPRSGRIA